jgi:hypothetical protein
VVVAVGGLTWYTQFAPPRRNKPAPPRTPASEIVEREVLRFSARNPTTGVIRAVWAWDDDVPNAAPLRDSGYALEWERMVQGYCYFTFRNVLSGPAELGVITSACDCSEAAACLLTDSQWQTVDAILAKTPWAAPGLDAEAAWQTLAKENSEGFHVPAGAGGLLRIGWKGRKNYGEGLHIRLELYGRSDEGGRRVQDRHDVFVPVRMAQPLLFDPKVANVALLSGGEAPKVEFYCWSPTREDPDVSFEPSKPDPLFEVSVRRLSAAECKELQTSFRYRESGGKRDPSIALQYRVRSALQITVTLPEQKDGQYRVLGHSTRALPVRLDGMPVDFPTPIIVETVKGDVEVGGAENQGSVLLQTFSAAEDRTVVVPIFTTNAARLETVSHYPDLLKVELTRVKSASTTSRTQWDLKVIVPAGSWPGGPLPENSEVVLRLAGMPPSGNRPATPSRLFRIPVVGNATR